MAIENLPNESGESHLSGAYIRSLVKQLTTTTTPTSKPCSNTTQNFTYNNNDTLSLVPNYNNTNTMTNTTTKKQAMAKSNHNQDQTHGHKKQVRRRLHTSRPYQERLLNMAEARKEIVTALKFHRAAMKQANDRKQQQQQQQQQSNNNEQQVARDYNSYDNCGRKVKSEQLSVDNFLSYQYQPLHNDRNYNQNYYSSPSNIISTTPMYEYDSLNNIPLPNQTLGLNLNLQAFTNLDTNFCHNNNMNTFSTSSNTTTTTTTNPSMVASPSSSPSTPVSITTSSTATEGVGPTISGDSSNNNMHPCLDEDEMAKMRSIGEQYQIEWDDTLNLVKSAWWFKFLKTVDFVKDSFYNNNNKNDHHHHHHDVPFEDELMEFPPWLSPTNDESFLHQQLDDSCSEDNTTLPWMDIEDIDGMDDEWLS